MDTQSFNIVRIHINKYTGLLLVCSVIIILLTRRNCDGMNQDEKDEIVLKDYALAMTLPKNKLELSLDYLSINDTLDIFDVRDNEFSDNSSIDSASLGDLQGSRLWLNYGLFPKTMLTAGVAYKDMDYESTSLSLTSLDLSLRQMLMDSEYPFLPFAITMDLGVHADIGNDLIFTSDTDINRMIDRLTDQNISVEINDQYVIFHRKTDGSEISLYVPREGRPDPNVSIEEMQDISPFIRLTAGEMFKNIFPNVFLEYGHTFITTRIDSSLPAYFPEEMKASIPDLPMNLDREENYLKIGANLLAKLPFNFMAGVEYNYLKLFRDSNLYYIDYNQIVNADLFYRLTDRITFNVGGSYYERQLNGILPFFYNEYTQTTFDHKYGVVRFGVTALIGGD